MKEHLAKLKVGYIYLGFFVLVVTGLAVIGYVNEKKFNAFTPAQHLAEGRRLWLDRPITGSEQALRHLDAIPMGAPESPEAKVLAAEITEALRRRQQSESDREKEAHAHQARHATDAEAEVYSYIPTTVRGHRHELFLVGPGGTGLHDNARTERESCPCQLRE